MILNLDKFQEACKKILDAVDANVSSIVTETLELKTVGSTLYMNVTNKEYFVEVKIELGQEVDFHATVYADLFLNLISKITTKEVELTVVDNTLIVKGNGNYKIPLIFDGDKLVELPTIKINNPTKQFNIANESLQNIFKFNTKELAKGAISKPIQRLFYIDKQGCITFTTGACVTRFNLQEDVKLLLNERIVKLFRLLKSETVQFTLGFDAVSETMNQTKVQFKDDSVTITAIIANDESLLNSVPAAAIRGRADFTYPYSVVLDRDSVLDALTRLLVFVKRSDLVLYTTMVFEKDGVTLFDNNKDNKEKVMYANNEENLVEPYTCMFNTNDLKLTLETCAERDITFSFGNNVAGVITRNGISNVLPEAHLEKAA